MNYHAQSGRLQMDVEDVKRASGYFLYAIRKVKASGALPLTPYTQDGPLTQYDFAMKSIIDGADAIGIDLGGRWGNEIDSTDHT